MKFITASKKLVILVFFLGSYLCVKGKTVWQNQMHANQARLIKPVPLRQYGFYSFGQLPVLKEFQTNLICNRKSFGPQRKRKGKVAYAVRQIFF